MRRSRLELSQMYAPTREVDARRVAEQQKHKPELDERSAAMPYTWMFTGLRDVPTGSPAVNIMTDAMPRASSGLETAPYTVRITAIVIRATITRRPPAARRRRP